jgi:myosin heavy subunit
MANGCIRFVEEFLLEDPKKYRYMTHGNVSVAGQDDGELYKQLLDAMDIMGFTKDEQDCKFALWDDLIIVLVLRDSAFCSTTHV